MCLLVELYPFFTFWTIYAVCCLPTNVIWVRSSFFSVALSVEWFWLSGNHSFVSLIDYTAVSCGWSCILKGLLSPPDACFKILWSTSIVQIRCHHWKWKPSQPQVVWKEKMVSVYAQNQAWYQRIPSLSPEFLNMSKKYICVPRAIKMVGVGQSWITSLLCWSMALSVLVIVYSFRFVFLKGFDLRLVWWSDYLR